MGDFYSKARTLNQWALILEQRLLRAKIGSTSSLSFRRVLRAYRSAPIQEVDGFELRDNELSCSKHEIFDQDPERMTESFGMAKDYLRSYLLNFVL